jgi:hypothetical protein
MWDSLWTEGVYGKHTLLTAWCHCTPFIQLCTNKLGFLEKYKQNIAKIKSNASPLIVWFIPLTMSASQKLPWMPIEDLLQAYDDECVVKDVLVKAYDDASVVEFWLPSPGNDSVWPGPWNEHQINDPFKKERDVTLPFIKELAETFPTTSPYIFIDTSGGLDGEMQNATLFLRNRSPVSLTMAAVFEWVGQNESAFPSNDQKEKLVGDCVRTYFECGATTREVHGAITDLSRIVAVKLTGLSRNGRPILQKTYVGEGEMVGKMLTQFAFAKPAALGINEGLVWMFGDAKEIEAKSVLGSGLHGSVFSVVQDKAMFVKVFKDEDVLGKEESALRDLNERNVPYVPTLHGIDMDKLAILASPLGSSMDDLQGSTAIWILGSIFVKCLQKVHEAGWCHRDVRPGNMAYLQNSSMSVTGDSEVILFDWASAVEIGQVADFVGTVQYAAKEVLEALYNDDIQVPAPEHDLESLVYSIYDLSRQVTNRPSAVHIVGSVNSHTMKQYVTEVKLAWEMQTSESRPLASLVADARHCRYEKLIKEMYKKGN